MLLLVLLRVRHPRPWCLTCCYLVWLPVSSARWSIKAAETAVDAVITEMNQRLPSVAEALVTLKAFRFLEVRLSPPFTASRLTAMVSRPAT